MTFAQHLPDGPARRRRSSGSASGPGLPGRPDRALSAMRSLATDCYASPEARTRRLAELLLADADTRFWTEADMREYAGLVNELLDSLGLRLRFTAAVTVRLGVKASTRPQGRYALFRLRAHPDGRDTCRRNLPDELSLNGGPS